MKAARAGAGPGQPMLQAGEPHFRGRHHLIHIHPSLAHACHHPSSHPCKVTRGRTMALQRAHTQKTRFSEQDPKSRLRCSDAWRGCTCRTVLRTER